MLSHTIWSVDPGKSSLKAVKLRREKQSIEILAIDKIDYPLSDNGVDFATQSREALSVFRSRNEVREPLIVAHPGQGTFSRFIKVPAFDQKKVKDMVRYEASQQIPFPLDEVIWDYHVVNRQYLPGEEREIGLFAVRKEAVEDYLVDFNREGLAVEMLSIGYLGLLNFIRYDVNPQEPVIVLDIGAGHTDLVFIDGDRFWVRPLPHSGNDVSRAIMMRFKISFPEAEKLKIESMKVPKQAAKIFQAVIQPKLQELVQEVHRSIGYYRSQAGEVKFTRLFLLGNGSKILGIKKFLEDRLGIPVDRVSSISRLRVNRDVNVKLFQSEMVAFGTALGCGIQAMGAGSCQVDLVPREEKVKKEIARKRKHVFFAAGVLLLLILLAHAMVNQKIDRAKAALKAIKIPELLKSEASELETVTDEKLRSSISLVKQIGETRQGPIDALRVVEKVLSAIPTAKHVDLKVRKDDKEAVAKAMAQAEAELKEKLWIPWMDISLVQWPEREATTAKKAPKEGAAQAPGTAPAYRVRAFAVIKSRDTASESNAALRSMFEAPVKKELTLGQLTKTTDVTVRPGIENLEAILYSPGERGGGGQELKQQGGPFYGAEMHWYMLPRFPEAPKAKEETDEDDEQPDKDKKKMKDKKKTR